MAVVNILIKTTSSPFFANRRTQDDKFKQEINSLEGPGQLRESPRSSQNWLKFHTILSPAPLQKWHRSPGIKLIGKAKQMWAPSMALQWLVTYRLLLGNPPMPPPWLAQALQPLPMTLSPGWKKLCLCCPQELEDFCHTQQRKWFPYNTNSFTPLPSGLQPSTLQVYLVSRPVPQACSFLAREAGEWVWASAWMRWDPSHGKSPTRKRYSKDIEHQKPAHHTQCDQSRNQVISVFRNTATIRITFGNTASVGQKNWQESQVRVFTSAE